MPITLSHNIPPAVKDDICKLIKNQTPKQDIYILQTFEGEEFQELWNTGKFLLGSGLVLESLKQGISLPYLSKDRRAVFCTALTGLVICTSNLSPVDRQTISQLAGFMNARVTHCYTTSVTHLITNTTNTQKYLLAQQRKDTIVSHQWIIDCWNAKKLLQPTTEHLLQPPSPKISKPSPEDVKHEDNTSSELKTPSSVLEEHENPTSPLQNCIISVSGYSTHQRQVIKQIVTNLGGTYSIPLNREVSHFICENPRRKKFKEAQQLSVPFLVSGKWLEECNNQNLRVDEGLYLLADSTSKNTQESTFVWHESIRARFNKEAENPGLLFDGIRFGAVSFDIDEICDLKEVVENYGASFISEHSSLQSENTFIIAPHGWDTKDTASIFVVSPNWIERCIEEGKLLDPKSHVLFTPLPCSVPLSSARGKTVSISGIKSRDRRSLRMLLIVMGFMYSEKLTPTVDYLLTVTPLTPSTKCTSAKNWNIPLIQMKWILQSASLGYLLPPTSFYLLPNLPTPEFPSITTKHSSVIPSPSPPRRILFKKESNNITRAPVLLGAVIFITHRVEPKIKERLEEMCSLTGAGVHSKLSQQVTHVVDMEGEGEIYSTSKIKAMYPSVKIVSTTWLSESFSQGEWLPETLFPPCIHPNMKLGVCQSPSANTKAAPAPAVSGKKRRKLEFIPDYSIQIENVERVQNTPPQKRQKLTHRNTVNLFRQHNEEEEQPLLPSQSQNQSLTPEDQNEKFFSTLGSMDEAMLDVAGIDSIAVPEPSFELPKPNNINEPPADTKEKLSQETDETVCDENSSSEPLIEENSEMPTALPEEDDTMIQCDELVGDNSDLIKETMQDEDIIDDGGSASSLTPCSEENAKVLEELEKLLQEHKPQENMNPSKHSKVTEEIQIPSAKPTTRLRISELYDASQNTTHNTHEEYHDSDDEEIIIAQASDDESQNDSQVVIYKDSISKDFNSHEMSIDSVCKAFESENKILETPKYFAFSSIGVDMKSDLAKIVYRLGGVVVESALHQMTHLIAKGPSRSLKYLSALAAGCWILSTDYLLACDEKGEWIDESSYECNFATESRNISPPRYWREKLINNGNAGKPFAGMKVALFVKHYEADVACVLSLGGCDVLYRSEDGPLDPESSYFYNISLAILDDALLKDKKTILSLKLLHKHSIRCISARYISDSLCKLPSSPLESYTISLRKRSSSPKSK